MPLSLDATNILQEVHRRSEDNLFWLDDLHAALDTIAFPTDVIAGLSELAGLGFARDWGAGLFEVTLNGRRECWRLFEL